MTERFHRMVVRSLRALRDPHRCSSNVVAQQAGQANVGAQQVNLANGTDRWGSSQIPILFGERNPYRKRPRASGPQMRVPGASLNSESGFDTI